MELKTKIRVLRKLGRILTDQEDECHYYSSLMGPYPAESVYELYQDKRDLYAAILGLDNETIEKYMNDYCKIEGQFVNDRLGEIPQAWYDLVRFLEVKGI